MRTSLVDVGCEALDEGDHIGHLLHRLVGDLVPFLAWISRQVTLSGQVKGTVATILPYPQSNPSRSKNTVFSRRQALKQRHKDFG